MRRRSHGNCFKTMLLTRTLFLLFNSFGNIHGFSSKHVIILFLIVQFIFEARAKYIEGSVHTQEQWVFLTRFCFYSEAGHFTFRIVYPLSYTVQKILLYYDSPWQWPAVYKKPLSCLDKESVLSRDNNQFINLSLESDLVCRLVKRNGSSVLSEPLLDCTGERFFETARERWWFIAISNCNSTKGLKFDYRIRMSNGNPGDLRHEHFSADEFGILEMSIAFLVLHIILLVMAIFSAVALSQRHLLHRTYKLFLTSLTIYCVGMLFIALAYCRYAVDGKGLPRTLLWGQLLLTFSGVIFLTLLLLLGKGFTVTRARLRMMSLLKIGFFLCVYSFTSAALFIYKETVFDPGEVLYMYESAAGHGLIVLKILGWAIFICSIVFTLKHYPEKALFYFPFLAFYTLWFLAGPIVILFANYVVDKWVREKAVFGVEVSITFLAFLIFWCLTIPTFNNINFPYHVRTTQIGIFHVQSNGDVVTTNLDNFHHHSYAPSAPPMENMAPIPTAPNPNNQHELGLYVIGPRANHSIAPASCNDNATGDFECEENDVDNSWSQASKFRRSSSAMRRRTPPPPYTETEPPNGPGSVQTSHI